MGGLRVLHPRSWRLGCATILSRSLSALKHLQSNAPTNLREAQGAGNRDGAGKPLPLPKAQLVTLLGRLSHRRELSPEADLNEAYWP